MLLHIHTRDLYFVFEHINTLLLMLLCIQINSVVACVSFCVCLECCKKFLSLVMSFACSSLAPTGPICMKFGIGYLH